MSPRWVQETKDPLFCSLEQIERKILYLRFAKEYNWRQVATNCRKRVATVQNIFNETMQKLQARAGVVEPAA